MRRSNVFVSYSHEDKKWLEKLRPFLKTLERGGGIKPWDDTQLRPGSKWKIEIKKALGETKVAVLLVSQAFLASDFIADEELTHFLKASEETGLTILWVAVSPSTWQQSPISQFQAANDPKRPLDSFSGSRLRNELVKIAQEILRCAQATQAGSDDSNLPRRSESVERSEPTQDQLQRDFPEFVTGAQASLYTRAMVAIRESLPLLQGVYSLDLDADQKDVRMVRQTVERDLNNLVEELGHPGQPSYSAVCQRFQSLLGQDISTGSSVRIESDPNRVTGNLGLLRNVCGLGSGAFVDTIDDEQNVTNFRIVVDYVTSLAWSWINNLNFFGPNPTCASLGTQLYYVSIQLSAIAEALQVLTSALDAASIGPARRRTLMLENRLGSAPVFLEDVLSLVSKFASSEGPRMVHTGSKYVLTTSFLPELSRLIDFLQNAASPANRASLPNGYGTPQVRVALNELQDELEELLRLCVIGMKVAVDPLTDADTSR
ncbi:MAG TPA: toll/interleukin-1 receptor domain-containing protein [Candidatus Dormibacteraeota bacterium]|jgi:hypothetical protein|nr:toll/interleukin-1 receptor domain-containing protein [Candidatus Dormibacteraeota bacterium]